MKFGHLILRKIIVSDFKANMHQIPGSRALSASFFDELSAVFEQLVTYRCPVVVCGDFHEHVDKTDGVHAAQLLQLLQMFDCIQDVVAEPTHTAGHTLDLVIARTYTDIGNLHVGGFVALAGFGRSSSVQACRYSLLVSPQQGAEVPDRLLCRSLEHCWSSALTY